MPKPTTTLTPLHQPDGSATYTCPHTHASILSSVNAPVELLNRRDALKPDDATLEVFVKPGTAPGGVGERYVEGLLRGVLGRVVLGREAGFPRRGVVVTLVVVGGDGFRGDEYLPLLPSLLHASLLSLLSASVPLSTIFGATVLAVNELGEITRDPEPKAIRSRTRSRSGAAAATAAATAATKSLHVLAFSSKGHLLLNESEGVFDFGTWERVYERAVGVVLGVKGGKDGDGDVGMVVEDATGQSVLSFIREVVEDRVLGDYAWLVETD